MRHWSQKSKVPVPKKQYPRLTSDLHTHEHVHTQKFCIHCQYRYNNCTFLYAHTHICTCIYMFVHWANPNTRNLWMCGADCLLSSTKHITHTQVLNIEDQVQHLHFTRSSRGMKSSVQRRFSKSRDFDNKDGFMMSQQIYFLSVPKIRARRDRTENSPASHLQLLHTSIVKRCHNFNICSCQLPWPLQTLDTWNAL